MEETFLGYLDKITDKLVHGWVCNPKDFNKTLWVEVYADNVKIGRVHANIYRNDLKDKGV